MGSERDERTGPETSALPVKDTGADARLTPHGESKGGGEEDGSESEGEATGGEMVAIHYQRPGRSTAIYRQRVLERRSDAIITHQSHTPLAKPLRVEGRTILEPGSPVVWFTFPGRWHDIGLFALANGTPTGLYANILTPVEFISPHEWHTTDLCLDIWIPYGGRARLLDEDELQAAESAGLIARELAERAREEAGRLLWGWGRG